MEVDSLSKGKKIIKDEEREEMYGCRLLLLTLFLGIIKSPELPSHYQLNSFPHRWEGVCPLPSPHW